MSALSNLTNTTGQSVTTLPSWYDQAQQNLVNQAQQSFNAAPQLNQTVAQGAINQLQGPNNPFNQATNTLNTISSGAANPWITDASGNVNPNVNTAMGGLFQAQNQELNQLMPNVTAPAEANAIASGNFGSLRGQTAVNKAKADAFSQLLASQNQAALSNQQVGTQAAANLGTVGQQGINTGMTVGQTQMTAPFQNTANLGNILASIQAPQTVNTTQTPSTLAQLTGLGSMVSGGLNALFNGTTTGTGANATTTPALWNTIASAANKIFGGNNTTGAVPAIDPAGGLTTGQTTDANGNIITDPTYGTGTNPYDANTPLP